MKAKKYLVLLLALALCFASACGSGNPSDNPSNNGISDNPSGNIGEDTTNTISNVAFLAPATDSEYWMNITDSTKAACDAAGISCTIYSAKSDPATQLEQIENCITMGVDAIIIDTLDPESTDDALVRARDAGIFVVMTTSVSSNTEAYDVGISASETQVGDTVAKAAAEWIDATFPDAEDNSIGVAIYSFPFRPIDIERTDAYENVINYTSKARIDVVYELSLANHATEIMEYGSAMLQTYPDVKCVLTYTDNWANPIDEILQGSSGVDLTKIANITMDKSTTTFTNIVKSRDGESTIVATIVPGINLDAQILEVLQGNFKFDDAANKLIYKEITTITADNIDQYFDN